MKNNRFLLSLTHFRPLVKTFGDILEATYKNCLAYRIIAECSGERKIDVYKNDN